MDNSDFGAAAALLETQVDGHTSMIQNAYNDIFLLQTLIDDLGRFEDAVTASGLISLDGNYGGTYISDLPPNRVGILLRLLNRVFSPYQTPTYTGGPGGPFSGTITRPDDLFDPGYDGDFGYSFHQVRTHRWDFGAPAYIELAYQAVPTTDPDAQLEVEYRFDDGQYKNMRHPSGSYEYIRGYGTFLEIRGPANAGPPHPNLRLLRNVVIGTTVVGSYVTIILIAAPSSGLPPDWNVPPEDPDDPDEGDEEDEEEDPEPMAKRIRLVDSAVKLEFYDKEE